MYARAQSGPPVSICVPLRELRNVARYYEGHESHSLSYYSCKVFPFLLFFVFFFFFFCFVRLRVSFAKFVDDNVERTKRWFWFLRLLLFLVFFFFRIIAHLDRSRIVPCLLIFFYFNASCVFSRTMEFGI